MCYSKSEKPRKSVVVLEEVLDLEDSRELIYNSLSLNLKSLLYLQSLSLYHKVIKIVEESVFCKQTP